MQYSKEDFIMKNNMKMNVSLEKVSKEVIVNYYFKDLLDVNSLKELLHQIDNIKNNRTLAPFKISFNFVYDFSIFEEGKMLNYLDFFIGYENKNQLYMQFQGARFENMTFKIQSGDFNAEFEKLIKHDFKMVGLDVEVEFVEYSREEFEEELKNIEEEQNANLMREIIEKQALAADNENIKTAIKKSRNTSVKLDINNITEIAKIPSSQQDVIEYKNTVGPLNFVIKGEVFEKNVVRVKNDHYWVNFSIYDGTDSILIKKYCSEEEKDLLDKIKEGDTVMCSGSADYDIFAKDVTFMYRQLEILSKEEKQVREDLAKEKRVELHLHTNMSALDGINSAEDFITRAKLYGHKAIAFTDHDGIYTFHDVMKASKKAGIKPLYGVELGFVDEERFDIAFTDEDIDLKEATYTVFDIETTGFSVKNDKIIQIGAMRLHHNEIKEKFNIFVNPEMHIPNKITSLTSITDLMVSEAPNINEALPQFLEFAKGSILVAHNATFDVSFIYEKMKEIGMPDIKFPVIDTLQLARNFYSNDLKTFNLKSLSKYFKVQQEHHHLADDDTRVTTLIFMQMLQTLYKNNIYNYKDINSAIDRNEAFKHIVPSHINLLVKNQVGYKNLFKVISDSLTEHYSGESRVLKSVLSSLREGILVGSGCRYGEVFECALNKSDEELEEVMSYYDYIEVQPFDIYRDMLNKVESDLDFVDDIDYEKMAKEAIMRIIATAEKLGKIVVATSDCHYIDIDEKRYRDICIATPKIGGGVHPLARVKRIPDQHFRTTDEMLDNFSFLGSEKAYEIVVTNTNKIADSIEDIIPFREGKEDLYSPHDDEFADSLGVPSIKEHLLEIVYYNAHRLYGETIPPFVQDRIDKELNSIINNGYAPIYYMAYLLVKKSNDDGYVVGSRGSVGSSLVATLMNITEVNALPPHYACPKCGFSAFKWTDIEKEKYHITEEQLKLDPILQKYNSGYDLPKQNCPCCGALLRRDGQDIPFETFLGFKGDKTPDIDLNFSGIYQPTAHEYIRTLMGEDRAFRAGTVGTAAANTAFGYVSKYYEDRHIEVRKAEIGRIAKHLVGVRRTTGQHPGGIVVVPKYKDIYDVTPIQYPADKTTNTWRTTHFEYHNFEANLLKLDILGHDDPTTLRYLFDYVEEHPDEFPFKTPQEIPVDDENVYKMFSETAVLGLTKEDIGSEVATFAIPEFGTSTTSQMLVDTRPKNFADLVKISGLAHGTDVWATNTQELVLGRTEYGPIPFDDVIGCRDDIMVYLIEKGLNPSDAFGIMEFVRKGKAAKKEDPPKWEKLISLMKEHDVPEWYYWSCGRIQYMFPKAHAVAYVLMAIRIAWFKYHKPLVFYSAFFSIRATQFEPDNMLVGVGKMRQRIAELQNIRNKTAKDDDLLTMYLVSVEMLKRGFVFLPIDIKLSHAEHFVIEGNGLRLPFISIPSLGENVAYDIMNKRNEKMFTSKEDVMNRTKMNKTQFEYCERVGAFGDLPDQNDNDEIVVGLFGFEN